jgi:hypothetical protein
MTDQPDLEESGDDAYLPRVAHRPGATKEQRSLARRTLPRRNFPRYGVSLRLIFDWNVAGRGLG